MNKYERILERSRAKHRDILKKMRYLSRLKKPNFDSIVHRFHDEVFDEIDCTECGLCCRNMGPVFRNTDIKHICSYIGSNEKEFIARYLVQDPDGVGYMLKELPCPFQADDKLSVRMHLSDIKFFKLHSNNSCFFQRILSYFCADYFCSKFLHTKDIII